MKKRLNYKKAIKSKTPEEVLNMYRDNKIELNDKEWDDVHKRIEKNNHTIYGIKIITLLQILSCLIVIIAIAITFNPSNMIAIKKCKEIKGHTCSRYEVQQFISNGNYNG